MLTDKRKEGTYAVYFREPNHDPDKLDERRMIYTDENGPFKTIGDAEKFAKKIWPGYQNDGTPDSWRANVNA